MLWENLKCQDFPAAVEASKGVCVIPLGAMEKHGLHMGVGTDSLLAEEIAKRAAAIEPVVIFPTFCFGHVNGLQHMNGSICLSNRLILDYMTELCREIARSGFKKILLLNGHGGNIFLFKTFCNSTIEEQKDYTVSFANFYDKSDMKTLHDAICRNKSVFPYLTQEDIDTVAGYCSQPMESGHADFWETIILMDVRPEAVDISMMDKEDGRSTHRMDHLALDGIYSPYVWIGNQPKSHQASFHPGANARIGRAMMQLLTEDTAKIFKTMKEDKELLAYNNEWNAQW